MRKNKHTPNSNSSFSKYSKNDTISNYNYDYNTYSDFNQNYYDSNNLNNNNYGNDHFGSKYGQKNLYDQSSQNKNKGNKNYFKNNQNEKYDESSYNYYNNPNPIPKQFPTKTKDTNFLQHNSNNFHSHSQFNGDSVYKHTYEHTKKEDVYDTYNNKKKYDQSNYDQNTYDKYNNYDNYDQSDQYKSKKPQYGKPQNKSQFQPKKDKKRFKNQSNEDKNKMGKSKVKKNENSYSDLSSDINNQHNQNEYEEEQSGEMNNNNIHNPMMYNPYNMNYMIRGPVPGLNFPQNQFIPMQHQMQQPPQFINPPYDPRMIRNQPPFMNFPMQQKPPYGHNPQVPFSQNPQMPYGQNPQFPFNQNLQAPYGQNPQIPLNQNFQSPYNQFQFPFNQMPNQHFNPMQNFIPVRPMQSQINQVGLFPQMQQQLINQTNQVPHDSSDIDNFDNMKISPTKEKQPYNKNNESSNNSFSSDEKKKELNVFNNIPMDNMLKNNQQYYNFQQMQFEGNKNNFNQFMYQKDSQNTEMLSNPVNLAEFNSFTIDNVDKRQSKEKLDVTAKEYIPKSKFLKD